MKHFNDYPIYFLAPIKLNCVVASFGHSHVVIQPEEINVGLGLLVTVNKKGNHKNKSLSL